MNKLFSPLLLLFFFATNAQIHELGVFVGGSNYVGDVGSTTYISPNKLAFGILYKWNKSPRHSYRISYTQSNITANDLDSEEVSRNQRGYHFENSIKELSLGLEFNFFEFNLHDPTQKVTPYIYSGINFLLYDELYYYPNTTEAYDSSNSGGFAIPITLGIKTNVIPHLILGLEVGARYALTDNLDGSNPKRTLWSFGNINNNDWYVFSGITLTYAFGEKACYCVE
jgi:hypothetical protein